MSGQKYWVMGVDKEEDDISDSVFLLAWSEEASGPLTLDNAEKMRVRIQDKFPDTRYFVIALNNNLC